MQPTKSSILRGPESRRFCGSAVRHRPACRARFASAASAAQDGGSSRNGATGVHPIGAPAAFAAGKGTMFPRKPLLWGRGDFRLLFSLLILAAQKRRISKTRPMGAGFAFFPTKTLFLWGPKSFHRLRTSRAITFAGMARSTESPSSRHRSYTAYT